MERNQPKQPKLHNFFKKAFIETKLHKLKPISYNQSFFVKDNDRFLIQFPKHKTRHRKIIQINSISTLKNPVGRPKKT